MINLIRHIGSVMLDKFKREPSIIQQYYHESGSDQAHPGWNVFMVDGKMNHGGMFDRLKGAITTYALSKAQGREFKLLFTYPFDIRQYLTPHSHNWAINPKEICYHYPISAPLVVYGEYRIPSRLLRKRARETHYYYGFDSLDHVNKKYGTHYDWGELYRELFKPTKHLQQYIDHYEAEIGSEYVAVHLRLMNLLGDKVETVGTNLTLDHDAQQRLMKACSDKIQKIKTENGGKRVMLCSDSNIFVKHMLSLMPDLFVIPGEVKHIDTAGHTDDSQNIKLFLDYYLIAGAQRVYSIYGTPDRDYADEEHVACGLYPSAFPKYAAKIGGKPFKRIRL